MILSSKEEYFAFLVNNPGVPPGLANLKATLDEIVTAIYEIDDDDDDDDNDNDDDDSHQDNFILKHDRHQCEYLLQHCIRTFAAIYNQDSLGTSVAVPAVRYLEGEFEKIRILVQNLSALPPLSSYLQRRETADILKDSHKSLDDCLKFFQKTIPSDVGFVPSVHEAAYKQDNNQFTTTLMSLSKRVRDIQEAENHIMDVIYGLRGEQLKLCDGDAQQRQYVSMIIKKLQRGQRDTSRPGVISSCQVSKIVPEELGEGGFGAVVAGRWNGQRVAIKKLLNGGSRKVLTDEFTREFEIWRDLEHKHIALLLGACIESSPPLLISSLYRFGNVIEYLERFPSADRIRLSHEITLGMCFLHEINIIHGDLKPTNILVDDGHHARITDFGLSKVKQSLTSTATASVSGDRLHGARPFVAPELFHENKIGYHTDVYAFSISVYQMMTGEIPFQHLDPTFHFEVVVMLGKRPQRPAQNDPSISRGLDENMWNLLEQCWAHDRNQRPRFEKIEDELRSMRTAHGLASPLTKPYRETMAYGTHNHGGEIANLQLSSFRQFTGHADEVYTVAVSPDGQRIASCSKDRTIRIWDVATGRTVAGPLIEPTGVIWSVAFSPDGKRITAGTTDKMLVFDASSGQRMTRPGIGHTDWVFSVAFSPDGKYIVSGSWDKTLRMWDAATGQTVAGPFLGHSARVYCVAFLPDGQRVVSGSQDRTIRVWDAMTGTLIAGPFLGHKNEVHSVASSPDGRHIVSGSYDESILVWDSTTGHVVAGPFRGHMGTVYSAVFSPDGQFIVSCSDDNMVIVWDAARGQIVGGPFAGHTGLIRSMAFSPDGKYVVSGSFDNTVGVWSVV